MAIKRLFSEAVCSDSDGRSFTGGGESVGACPGKAKVAIVRCTECGVGQGGIEYFFINFLVGITRPNRLISKAFSKISLDLRAATH
jgi:hypothetical protein